MKDYSITVDRESKVKIYHQIYLAVSFDIESGKFPLNHKLPSVRNLAAMAKISRNSVTTAYDELMKAGYIYSRSKSGYYSKLPEQTVPNFNLQKQPEEVREDNEILTVDAVLKDRRMEEAPSLQKSSDLPNIFSSDKLSSFKRRHSVEDELSECYRMAFAVFQNNFAGYNHGGRFGDDDFKAAIKNFVSKSYKLTSESSNIVVGSDVSQLLFNILQLSSFKKSSENSVQPKGLLQMAESMNEAENFSFVPPSFAAFDSENLDRDLKNIILNAGTEIKNDFDLQSLSSSDYFLNFIEPNSSFDSEIFKSQKAIFIGSFSKLVSPAVTASFAILPENLLEGYKKMYCNFSCPLSSLVQCALTDYLNRQT